MNCCTRFTLAAVASLVLFGCRDNTVTPPSSGPVFAVSDGAHNGNPDFFFLPPMFKNPNTSPNFEPAAFNPNLRPAVEICLLGLPAPDGTRDCVGAPVTRFSPSQISLNSTDQLYQVNWNTALSNLNLANFYRIQVLVGTRVLGFADVDPVVSLTGTQLQNLQTGEFIPLVDGRTLPIKFRIETGVLCASDGTPCTSSTINLNTGGTIELIYGPQGGYHVWGRARFHGFEPDVDVAFAVTRLRDGALLQLVVVAGDLRSVDGDVAGAGADLRHDAEQALVGKPTQPEPNAGATQPEPTRELRLGEPGTRRQIAAHDRSP